VVDPDQEESMGVTEVEAAVIWEPGTYVTWGDGFADDPRRNFATVVGYDAEAQTYAVEDSEGLTFDVAAEAVVPAYRPDLDAIPDVTGRLVRVGDWIEYERNARGVASVIVTEIKPHEQCDLSDNRYGMHGKHTGILDPHFSSVLVKGYGFGSTFLDVSEMNFRGDWTGARSRDPHGSGRYTGPGAPVLRKLDLSREQVLDVEIAAQRRMIEELRKVQAKIETRLGTEQDKLDALRRERAAI
jgi:hypothetical protein